MRARIRFSVILSCKSFLPMNKKSKKVNFIVMKVVILPGGFGTRLMEETERIPKPMVEIGGKPILWHIMKIYFYWGFKEFIIALGYKGHIIKGYFMNYYALNSNISVNLGTGEIELYDKQHRENRIFHLVDTGLYTNTGGRVKRLQEFIGNQKFMLTYGDRVANINIQKLIEFHKSHGKIATITAVRPPARFGRIIFDGDRVKEFTEKTTNRRSLDIWWIYGL